MINRRLIMPKQTAELDKLLASLEIYNEYNDWLENDIYVNKMRERFSELRNSDHSNVRKQCEIANYYGFIDHDNNKSIKKITKEGKDFLESDNNGRIKILLTSLNNIQFGKNNSAVPNCNSIVEPPKLFISAIFNLDYITNYEFIFLLNEIHKNHTSFDDNIEKVNNYRESNFDYDQYISTNKIDRYRDNKINTFLQRLNIIKEHDHKYYLDSDVKNKYSEIIANLDYVNTFISQATYDRDELDQSVSNIILEGQIDLDPQGNESPAKKRTAITVHKRDPRIVAAVKMIANGKCECCGNDAPFIKDDGSPYLEVHHIKRLADNGSDKMSNAVAICPNCHMALHHSNNSIELAEELINKIDRLIKE